MLTIDMGQWLLIVVNIYIYIYTQCLYIYIYNTYFNNFNGYNHGILTFLITMSWDYIYPPSTGTAAPSWGVALMGPKLDAGWCPRNRSVEAPGPNRWVGKHTVTPISLDGGYIELVEGRCKAPWNNM